MGGGNMSSRKVKLGDFLIRSKIPVDIEDNKQYKRVTIRTKHQGVSVRDFEIGAKIGTKKQFILNAGQFVLSKIDAMYGAFGIAPSEVDGAIITGNFWAYDYDKNMVCIDWLNHFTNSPDFYDLCRRASTGITHRKYLDEDFFLSYEVNLPDLEDQNSLVFSINGIRDKISSLEVELSYQLTLLENLNQAILQEAVQGKLVPQDDNDEPASELLKRIKAEKAKSGKKEKPLPPIKPEENPFEIPESWVWCKGNAVANYIDPQPSHRTPPVSMDGIPYVAMSDINKNGSINFHSARKVSKMVFEEHRNRYQLQTGDFIFGKIGTIGKPVKLSEPFNYTLSANIILIQPDRQIIDEDFLFYFLSSPIADKILRDKKSTTSYPVFGMGKARDMIIPLPPLPEQKRIVAEIENQFAKTKQLKEHILANQQATEQLLKALLHQAFEVRKKETV